jgi:hypothetical protein
LFTQILRQFYCLTSILLLTLEFPHSIGSSKKEPIWWQWWKEEKFGSKLSVFFDSDSNFDLAKIQRDRSQTSFSLSGWLGLVSRLAGWLTDLAILQWCILMNFYLVKNVWFIPFSVFLFLFKMTKNEKYRLSCLFIFCIKNLHFV